jgi:hypothetical protein
VAVQVVVVEEPHEEAYTEWETEIETVARTEYDTVQDEVVVTKTRVVPVTTWVEEEYEEIEVRMFAHR